MKILARSSFLLVTMLWGSFYAVTKTALTHVDPIIFTFFEALVLVPIALTLLIVQRQTLSLVACKRGVLLGSCLCIATLTITVAEKFTGATTTAFFPSTGGIFATVITATVLRRSLRTSIWVACALSLLGVLFILHASLSGSELRGDVIALLGALLFTVYLFLVERDAPQEGPQFWAIVGIEHLSFALWMLLFSLLFGDWQHFHPVLSHDIPVVLYVALACTFLPVILIHVAHRSLDPLETSFISILEPLWGGIMAHVFLGEVVSLSLYLGGGLIMAGTLVHLLGTIDLLQSSHLVIGWGQKRVSRTRNRLMYGYQILTSVSRESVYYLILLVHQEASSLIAQLLGYRSLWRRQPLGGRTFMMGQNFILFAKSSRWSSPFLRPSSKRRHAIRVIESTAFRWSKTLRFAVSLCSVSRSLPCSPVIVWLRQSQYCAPP